MFNRTCLVILVAVTALTACIGCSDQPELLGPKEDVVLLEMGIASDWPTQNATLEPAGTVTVNPQWDSNRNSIRFFANATGDCQAVGTHSVIRSQAFDVKPYKRVTITGVFRCQGTPSGYAILACTLYDMTAGVTRNLQLNVDGGSNLQERTLGLEVDVNDLVPGEGSIRQAELVIDVLVEANASDCQGATWAEVANLQVIGVPK